MKPMLLSWLALPPSILAGNYFNDSVFAPLWHDRFREKVITPHEGWGRPGSFTHPPAASRNSTDFDRNERIFMNSTYPLSWTWTSVTKSITWDLYLVNQRYEKRLLFRMYSSLIWH